MASVNEERAQIKQVYPHSDSWAAKVDKMSEAQVKAIHIRFKAESKL